MDRTTLLIPQKRKTTDYKVRFVTNYNIQWPNLRGIFFTVLAIPT